MFYSSVETTTIEVISRMAKQSNVKSRRKLLNPVFHLQSKEEDDSQLTRGIIKIVRRTGQLNLSGRSLAHVPEKMFTMYELTDEDTAKYIDFNKEPEEENWWQFKPLSYLDLSSNVLQEIPGKIGMFEDLTALNLQDNNITSLPPEIGKLTKLTKLNLSHNKINVLPPEFYKLVELQVLSLAHNNLEKISKNFGDLVMLQQLDVSHNVLTKLPPGMGFLVRLTEINLSHNKLIELPPDIVNLRGLLKLDVTHNDLVYLPKMGELAKLQFLYAQHNNIEEIPDFEGCTHLQQVYFGNNYIKEVTPDFCENTSNLKILDLRDNKIEQIPNEIAMLQHLIRLDLTNNDLTDLPNSLGLLAHLQNLQLEGNKLKKIRADIIKGGTMRILKHLKEQLADEEVENVPKASTTQIKAKTFPDRYTMKHSRALNVTMKQLTSVPDDVFEEAKLAEVTIVDLCKNKLSSVPSGLQLIAENLTELNLSMNLISEIPAFISNCIKLKYFDLGNNLLSNLPECLSSLVSLRELVLNNNRFNHIPDCVYGMVGLEILLACDNKITDVNVDGLKNLKRIATLDLTNNNIGHIPPELGNITQLRTLELRGNCFRQPRYAILEQGTASVLSYLRDRIPK
ncbi:leucine-rich repeat-containing protein 40-like isoform X2 [Tribolium madens]|uniref:leucine-rich repeat-containing protein 40-like isoform X2 n=1 Tax=Tribolium madens TaxID=41895 RepID=UPI001CF75899|nr:leucine-rich repeat-containing protein 40-like isoform X2 [Tribolium madens]